MDVNSGSVHVVDDIVYDMIPLIEPLVNEGIKDADTIKAAVLNLANIPYPDEDVLEAVDEVLALEAEGQLFAPDIYESYVFDFKKRQTVVKALCLHIAHDCNLACQYCFAEEGEYPGRRALMTINGKGEFYVLRDMATKVITDAEKVMTNTEIDSEAHS